VLSRIVSRSVVSTPPSAVAANANELSLECTLFLFLLFSPLSFCFVYICPLPPILLHLTRLASTCGLAVLVCVCAPAQKFVYRSECVCVSLLRLPSSCLYVTSIHPPLFPLFSFYFCFYSLFFIDAPTEKEKLVSLFSLLSSLLSCNGFPQWNAVSWHHCLFFIAVAAAEFAIHLLTLHFASAFAALVESRLCRFLFVCAYRSRRYHP